MRDIACSRIERTLNIVLLLVLIGGVSMLWLPYQREQSAIQKLAAHGGYCLVTYLV